MTLAAAVPSAPAPQSARLAIAAATALNLPLGSLYAFSVFLKPLEASLGVTRAELSFVFGLATIAFCLGMNLAPVLFRLAPAPTLLLLYTSTNAAGIALAATADGVVQLALGYGLLFGLGGGAGYITVQQGVNLAVRGRKGLLNGYMVGLYPAGAMLAAPLFGWANGACGRRWAASPRRWPRAARFPHGSPAAPA